MRRARAELGGRGRRGPDVPPAGEDGETAGALDLDGRSGDRKSSDAAPPRGGRGPRWRSGADRLPVGTVESWIPGQGRLRALLTDSENPDRMTPTSTATNRTRWRGCCGAARATRRPPARVGGGRPRSARPPPPRCGWPRSHRLAQPYTMLLIASRALEPRSAAAPVPGWCRVRARGIRGRGQSGAVPPPAPGHAGEWCHSLWCSGRSGHPAHQCPARLSRGGPRSRLDLPGSRGPLRELHHHPGAQRDHSG